MVRTEILGTGSAVPDNIVTNDDMGKLVTTDDAWIQQRSGIKQRRHLKPGQGGPVSLGKPAAERAMAAAGIAIGDVDFVICTTQNPEYYSPGTGCFLHAELGLADNVGVLEVRNQCSGFLYALQIADAYIRAGVYRRILLVGCEVHSTGLEYTDEGRHITVLFGDGSGAMVLGASESADSGILSTEVHADGRFARELWVEGCGGAQRPRVSAEQLEQRKQFPYMNGQAVFKKAVGGMAASVKTQLKQNGLDIADVDHFFPHQANKRISETVGEFIKIDPAKVDHSIERYGNCSSASIPLALDDAVRDGRVKKGDVVLMASFAAGFVWGAALLRY